jgi:hypothetical protein
MTAQEARDITISKQKSIEEIYESIQVMARSSCNYCCLKILEVREPEKAKEELEANGFKVEVTEFFNITW